MEEGNYQAGDQTPAREMLADMLLEMSRPERLWLSTRLT
jgi:hypothetical protein